ncbi:hypothetical protein [Noviherbaspirillum massiliense]|uniref:hypothetical protein n=1 Tax=Noviherbaspirillum massiliense TaxID=1465823 RepID=UPI0002F4FFA4|nr:hypothetical protein [Noviherbaspirillum massiliense]
MKLVQRPSSHLAIFLLSVALHLGVAAAIGPKNGIAGGQSSRPEPASTIAVELKSSESRVLSEKASAVESEKTIEPAQSRTTFENHKHEFDEHAADAEDRPSAEQTRFQRERREKVAAVPVLPASDLRYFPLSDLTEAPVVVEDIPSGRTLILPDVAPPPINVSLLINEQGEVDEVVIHETALSELATRFITNAFLKTKFRPGKIGYVAVKSELNIEVRLEDLAVISVQKPVPVY